MTKPLTIDTSASWASTITTIQDGDVASEAVMDTCMDSVADRLGYLKTKADGSVPATITGIYTIGGTPGSELKFTLPISWYSGVSIYNSAGLVVQSGSQISLSSSASLTAGAGSKVSVRGAFGAQFETLNDANSTMGWAYESRVPTLTANRTYTLPDPASIAFSAGYARKRVVKVNSSAFICNVNDPVLGLVGQIDGGSHKGWIDFVFGPSDTTWRISAWGGDIGFILPLL